MWGRATAAALPGFILAAALASLLGRLWPGPWQATLVPGLVLLFPLWISIAAASFRFAGGWRAWGWIGSLALAALGALWLLQATGWAA
ncbi:membrane protein [Lysobacter concretionis Ko07 = DSM 16239]|uniref:Membrane protein n=1 Tax=Lysobacter concretionis Ko07 = DSM 16239 TaxID=1122185 RepID=A0A0A0EKA5_9GAMM|nr:MULTISPECIES: hypothetical protein [Lysobacter]KGM51391.1 membrane protein [Lysobacter concretionis Ko07 = DSM 16239]QOD91098.1 hypothetical protein H2514_13245 [Lysobacter sp. CW239]